MNALSSTQLASLPNKLFAGAKANKSAFMQRIGEAGTADMLFLGGAKQYYMAVSATFAISSWTARHAQNI